MVKLHEATAMLPVSRTRLDHALARYRQALQEAQQLLDERAEIDRLRHSAIQCPADPAMGALGADGLWQDWLLQRRTEIQGKLALNRARQMDLFARARDAFARHEAVQGLCEAARQDEHQIKSRRADQALEALIMLGQARER